MYAFKRFSEDAKRVLQTAQEEAERSRHSYIGTEHLLLGVLQVEGGTGQRVLAGMGVEREQVRELVKHAIGRGQRIVREIIPTSRVKKVIEISFEEATRMDSELVDTGHLLIGIVMDEEGIAAHVLKDLGATRERVVDAVWREMTGVQAKPPEPTGPVIDAQHFRDVMSTFPSGVVIVTAFGLDGLPRGLTVNAFCAVSLDPPLALVCIDKTSNTLPAVQHTQGFTANILATGREALARRMATKVSDKFQGLEWRQSESKAGGPILIADTAAHAVCRLKETIEGGDHWILIGTVVEGGHQSGVAPMVFSRRGYHQI